ncbi:MAG: ATP-binding protein [Oscillospiraceae bacterium]|nr:ATP-binding protein [Oscillospiraceae bacterium]
MAMDQIHGILESFELPRIPDFNLDEFEKMRMQWVNDTEGNLQGLDCRTCRNKGYIMYLDEHGNEICRECECMTQRRTMERVQRSGLQELLAGHTFENYQINTEWQKSAKAKSEHFSQNPDGWFFIGGQSGAGKTHLCTAICNVLIRNGYEVRYILWRELLHKLESNRFADSNYIQILDEIKTVDVLYLDDFLKTKGDKSKMASSVEYAFEIINARYNTKKLTLISSEWMISEIADLDEATAGRIFQSANKNMIMIERNMNRNFRLN